MKNLFKIFKFLSILIFSLLVILFSASFLLQDKVAHIILGSLNSSLSTKLDVGAFRLSFLRRFPKASLELRDVVAHSSSNFSSEQFSGINTDTLLKAKYVTVEFSITDIINGNYNIERIGARTGRMNFFSDLSGFVNYDISVRSDNPGGEDITINLEKINLQDIKVYYNNLAVKLIINGKIKNGKFRSRIKGDNIDFIALAETEISSFRLYGTTITKPVEAVLNVSLQSSRNGILFKKGSIAIDNYDFGIEGFVSSDDILDLNLTGHNIDIARIRNYIPEKYMKWVSEYNPSGIMLVNCKIKGPLTRTKNPHIEIDYNLRNGHIAFGRSDISISNLSFSGSYSNGTHNSIETSQAVLKDLSLKLGSSEYYGSFSITGFTHPRSEISLKGRVLPAELKEFFNISSISSAGGSVDADLKLVTDFWPADSITLNDILNLKPEASFTFNSFTLGLQKNKLLVNDVNGNLTLSDIIHTSGLNFRYGDQNFKVDGDFSNLPEWISGRPVQMKATANIEADRFNPENFLAQESVSAGNPSAAKGFSLPGDLILDINFKLDSLNYKTYHASNVSGKLTYKPRLLTFKSLEMDALNGTISGNCFLVQNMSRSFIAKGSFNISDIDVNKAFRTFRNFGQDFIKAENLSGDLSGTVSVLLPLDSLLKPQIKSLSAEGKYTLLNGALINFEPIKELSSFIELSELENIHFEKLENDFFIKSNFLYLPQMDVKSSAADLSVNGRHSFDNDYEYHVRMLLSEILSKKRKKNPKTVSEFGVVEDDGLGRTSILLKVVNKGEDVKVSYDIKAASAGIKSNIRSERQTLKSILNQEYGWYKSDTTVKPKASEKKSRFKISWDGMDSTANTTNTNTQKKENTIKNFLKKK